MMFKFLKTIPVYVKVYVNQIEIVQLNNGSTLKSSAVQPFSSARLAVADFDAFELLLRRTLQELTDSGRTFMPSYNILIQQFDMSEGGLSSVEMRALRDAADQAGGKRTVIVTHTRELSLQEAILEIKNQPN